MVVVDVAALLELGRAHGLDAVGVAPADPFVSTRHDLESRKAAGLHAGMAFTYRNPERSTTPAAAVPGARSLVVGALNYWRPRAPAPPGGGTGDTGPVGPDAAVRGPARGPVEAAPGSDVPQRGPGGGPGDTRSLGGGPGAAQADGPTGSVARYAWADHYRDLRAALEVVAGRLREDGWRARVLVDDNALVDREAAARAGLGWYGKNANLLLPGRGSWFVLGSVVTDAPLAEATPTERVADGCGTCRRCLDGCPTGAIVAPGVVDARRCLAWLLQAEGDFPRDHRVALGDRIYGCDDCQEVCPPNRLAVRRSTEPAGSESTMYEQAMQDQVDILAMLDATDDELIDRHGRWYIPRRDPRYLRRNALVVLGNTASPTDDRAVAAVRRAARDGDAMLRRHAVWAARRMGRDDVVADLRDDPDPSVRNEWSMPVEVRS